MWLSKMCLLHFMEMCYKYMHASVVVHLYYYIMYISEVQADAKHAAMP